MTSIKQQRQQLDWLPTSINDCVSWWDAWDLLDEGLADGDPISTWNNKINSSLHLTSAGALRPIFKSADGVCGQSNRPIVRFDGTLNQVMNTATTTTWAQPLTIFVAAKHPATGVGAPSVGFLDSATGITPRLRLSYASTSTNLLWNAGTQVTISSGFTAGNMEVLTGVFSSPSDFIGRINGVQQTIAGANAGAGSLRGVKLGGSSTGRDYTGDVAEILIYNRALTDNELLAVERYLRNKHVRRLSWAEPTTTTGEGGVFREVWVANNDIDYWITPTGNVTAQPANTNLTSNRSYDIILPGSARALAGPNPATWITTSDPRGAAALLGDYMATDRRALRRVNGCALANGVDIKVIGGVIIHDHDWVADAGGIGGNLLAGSTSGNHIAGGGDYDKKNRALAITNQSGIAHIEGVHIKGDMVYEAINVNSGFSTAITQLQFVRSDICRHILLSGPPWDGAPPGGDHDGGDHIQTWRGPDILRFSDVTFGDMSYQGMFLTPTDLADGSGEYWAMSSMLIQRLNIRSYGRNSNMIYLGSVLPAVATTGARDSDYPAASFSNKFVLVTGSGTWYRSNGSSWGVVTMHGGDPVKGRSPTTFTETYIKHAANGAAGGGNGVYKIFQCVVPSPTDAAVAQQANRVNSTTALSDAEGEYVDWPSAANITGKVRAGAPPGGDYCSLRYLNLFGAYRSPGGGA